MKSVFIDLLLPHSVDSQGLLQQRKFVLENYMNFVGKVPFWLPKTSIYLQSVIVHVVSSHQLNKLTKGQIIFRRACQSYHELCFIFAYVISILPDYIL